jgi:hypothetical protein
MNPLRPAADPSSCSTATQETSTNDAPAVPKGPDGPPPPTNTGSSSTSTTLDLSMFPTVLQAQLAQFTVDLQDYKSARTSLACNGCRSRKVKCSGDRPVCSACTKSGNGETCEYPRGHAKRRKRSAMDSYPEREVGRLAGQDVQREDTPQTKRHRREREDDDGVAERSTLSSTSRFQTLRTAATLPYNPAKNPRTEDVETQRIQKEVSRPIPDDEVVVHHRGASELDTGSQQQQQQHERVQGCDYDWSFFGTTPSTHQAGPSKLQRTDYREKGRHSRSVQDSATAGTDRDSGGSTRLRVPYFRCALLLRTFRECYQ